MDIPRQIGATAWRGSTLVDPDAWSFDLRSCGGGFDEVAAEVRRRLFDGPGFVIVRGFPVGDGARDRAIELYARLMGQFGAFLPQNTKGDHLHFVQTRGLGADRQHGSRGSGELLFHTDQAAAPPELLPAVLGLLTLERAANGGHTQLMSGPTLVNELLAVDRALVEALLPPAPFGREDEGVSDAPPVVAPILAVDGDGRARLRYNRFFTEVGARQTGRALSPALVAAFDAADEILARPELPLQFLLDGGDALIADNSVVLHNRSAYEDDDHHQRCLVRAWVR